MTTTMDGDRGTIEKTATECDAPLARLYLGDETWHDGAGWYFVDDEYPEDGSCGAFPTRDEAKKHAENNGYVAYDRTTKIAVQSDPAPSEDGTPVGCITCGARL